MLLGDVPSADLTSFTSVLDHVLKRLRGAAAGDASPEAQDVKDQPLSG